MKKLNVASRGARTSAGKKRISAAGTRLGVRAGSSPAPRAGVRSAPARSVRTRRFSGGGTGGRPGKERRVRTDRGADKASALWQREGLADGAAWRAAHPEGTEAQLAEEARRSWQERAGPLLAAGAGGKAFRRRLQQYGLAYAAGLRQGSGMRLAFEPLPLRGTASAVVYAPPGGELRLRATLDELERLPLEEIVVVLDDRVRPLLVELAGRPRILAAYRPGIYSSAHAARAEGARLTGADHVLIVDGEQPCSARQLGALLLAADAGADVVLSNRSARERLFHRRGEAAWLREFLNVSLGKPALRSNAIGGVPYALTRRALDTIGPDVLAAPAKAQAAALLAGLRVAVCDDVPCSGEQESAAAAASGHAEAWRLCLSSQAARLQFPDRNRNRHAIGGEDVGTDGYHHTEL